MLIQRFLRVLATLPLRCDEPRACRSYTSNNGEMRDVIKDGRNGFLAKTGDWQQMADLAIRAVQNPKLAVGISTEGRRDSWSYSWHTVATETGCFYESLLERMCWHSLPEA
jgi:glycosyltransferase involved in cell wall biosynthesis